MPVSKFTDEVQSAFPELVADGASIAEASKQLGLRHQTVKDWLTRGRKESEGAFFEFARAVDGARAVVAELKSADMTEAELRGHVAKAVRAGSVQAMKLMHEMLRASKGGPVEDDPFADIDAVDEVGEKRRARAG